DDCMPKGLSGACQAHCQRKQGKQYSIWIVITFGKNLIRADARVLIDVTRLGHSHHRVQKQHAIHRFYSALGHFFVCPVQWVARLKGNYVLVSRLFQLCSYCRWSKAQFVETVARRKLQYLKPARDI